MIVKNKIIPESGSTVVEIIIVVVLIALLVGITTRNPTSYPACSQQEACINNLRLIDSAKRQWALEKHKQSTDTPQLADLQPYLGRGPNSELPCCPADSANTFATSYALGSVKAKPVCLIMPTSHVLPKYEWLYEVIHYRDLTALVIRLFGTLGIILGAILWRRHSQIESSAPNQEN
jgi:competence protein ComGC